ncbi:MAG TPA: AAA family ATPase [Methyloceanibacter sp.]|nr:AAA family ATPase [Methyloceanibacter sp.]
MRRFAQDGVLDRLAEERRLSLEIMGPLAAAITDLHARADRILTDNQAVAPLRAIIAEHQEVLAENFEIFPPEAAQLFVRRTREAFEKLCELLRSRAHGGHVRHCHGDLHLRNIVEIAGKPVLFDALEFDDSLATIDVLYDLAFLLMDLGKRGLGAHANAVLNAYLDDSDTGNLLGLAMLPLFLSLRAMIRAKVELLRARAASTGEGEGDLDDVRAYFDLACTFLAPAAPHLIAIGGLSGSGKSVIARAIAPDIGAFPGAVIVRSDVERKRLFGVAPEAPLPAHAYTQSISDQVYVMCRKRAALALEAGRVVIIDAVHAKLAEREAVEALAAAHGAAFTGLWLDVPPKVMRERVGKRRGDVSDATPQVVDAQLAYDLGAMDFDTIDASGSVEDVAARCLDRMGR